MNQHDPIFAYKPSQLSLLPLAPNNSDGLIVEFTSFTFLPRRGTGFVREATCCGVPWPCKKWESEWGSKLCLSFWQGTFERIICTRRRINWDYKWQVDLLIVITPHLGLAFENPRETCDSIEFLWGEIRLSLIVVRTLPVTQQSGNWLDQRDAEVPGALLFQIPGGVLEKPFASCDRVFDSERVVFRRNPSYRAGVCKCIRASTGAHRAHRPLSLILDSHIFSSL